MHPRLPGELSDAMRHLNDAMPLYLTLAAGLPLQAPIVLAPKEPTTLPVIVQVDNPTERAMRSLEQIRNEIQDAALSRVTPRRAPELAGMKVVASRNLAFYLDNVLFLIQNVI